MVFLNQGSAADGKALYVEQAGVLARFDFFRELIAGMQADGSARAGDPRLLGEALICSLIGIAHALVTIPEYPWMARKRLLAACLQIVETAFAARRWERLALAVNLVQHSGRLTT